MNVLLGLIITFLSYVIPKKKNLFIFGSIDGKSFSGNSKALYLYINKNHPNIKTYYFIKGETHVTLPGILTPKSLKYYISFFRAEYIFIDSSLSNIFPGRIFFGRFNVVNLWHGDPIKKMWYGETTISKIVRNKYINFLFTPITKLGASSSESSQKILNENFGNNNFKITGLPRNDIFFDDSLIFSNIESDLGLQNYSKVLLYTPTWRTETVQSPFTPEGLKKLDSYLKKENYLLIFKGHFAGKESINNDYCNIINAPGDIDIQEIMKYSDILISDYSSIYIDFLLTKRPVIFYTYDYNFYLKNNQFSYNFSDVILNQTQAYNEYELIDIIQNINTISEKTEYKNQYKKILNIFHAYTTGGNCERILHLINNR